MPDTKTLSGGGWLMTATADLGEVGYRLRIWTNDSAGWQIGDGRVATDDIDLLLTAYDCKEQVYLKLQCSKRIPIRLTHAFGGQFVVNGPIDDAAVATQGSSAALCVVPSQRTN
jgi:hypothetical protein